MYFSLGLQRTLRITSAHRPEAKVIAYLDDIAIMGKREHVLSSFDYLRDKANNIGLFVNSKKSVLFSDNISQPVMFQAPVVTNDGLKLLGTPVGTIDFMKQFLAEKLTQQASVLEVISNLDPTLGTTLVRACVNNRPHFLMRTNPPPIARDSATDFDKAVDQCLLKLVGLKLEMPFECGLIRHLPANLGGLGIRRMVYAEAQFSSSFLRAMLHFEKHDAPFYQRLTLPGMSRNQALATIKRNNISKALVLPGDLESTNQVFVRLEELETFPTSKQIQAAQDSLTFTEVSELLRDNPSRRAWFLSQATTGSSLWFFNATNPAPILRISESDFQLNVKLRLLLPLSMMEDNRARRCACGDFFDKDYGYHALNCSQAAPLRTERHNLISKAVQHFLNYVGYRNGLQREVKLSRGSCSRIADLKYDKDGDQYVDVSIINPASTKFLSHGSNTEGGRASLNREHAKSLKYAPLGNDLASKVLAFVVESPGRIGPKAIKWIDEMSQVSDVVQRPDPRKKSHRKFLLNRISTILAQSHAKMIKTYLDKSTIAPFRSM